MARALDRSDLVDKAARLVTRGDLDGAVTLYEKLFQNDSKDWSIGNTLGDLYIRTGKADAAIAHFMSLAEHLASDGFAAKSRALYRKILRIQPDNESARRRVDELERNESAQVSPFLKRVLETARAARESAVVEPDAPPEPMRVEETRLPAPPRDVPAAAPMPASSSEWADEWAAVLAPDQEAVESGVVPAPDPSPAVAVDDDLDDFRQVILAADGEVARRNFTGAVSAIERFLASQPQHIEALEKLIDVGVEGRLDRALISAQARLAGACYDCGRTEQAYNIAVDLTEREPAAAAHRELLARVSGARDVSKAVPDVPPKPVPASDVDSAFEEIRTALIEEAAAAAEERLTEAERLIESQQFNAAVASLEEAMCAPHLRASAGSRLAGVYRDRGAPMDALACLEWVAQVPPATEEGGHELAYQLALTLEAIGQESQALGVYRELLAEVGPQFRDVATRAERLAAA